MELDRTVQIRFSQGHIWKTGVTFEFQKEKRNFPLETARVNALLNGYKFPTP